jgi:hypothetical protein
MPDSFFSIVSAMLLLGAVIGLVFSFFYTVAAWPRRLLFLLLGVVALGQIGRIPPGGGSGDVLLIDALAALLFGIWAVWAVVNRASLQRSQFHLVWIGFLLVAFVGLLFTPLDLSKKELAFNGFYLMRLLFYSSLVWIVSDLMKGQESAGKIVKWIIGTGTAILLIGFLQLLVFPDIGVLSKFGWDPHVGRFVSTFLDPNYLGGYLALILSLILARSIQEKKPFPWILILLLLVGAVYTYSRSGYLAVALVVLAYGLRYSWKLMLLAIVVAVPMGFAIPRVAERISGGFSVDKTSRDRIDSWQKAFVVMGTYPATGVGYNNYRAAQEQLGLIQLGDQSHSGSGSDSSLLNIYATTGLAGIFLFFLAVLFFLKDCWRLVASGEQSPRATAALALIMATPALFVHAFFVNAWFYPFILVSLAALAGVVYTKK